MCETGHNHNGRGESTQLDLIDLFEQGFQQEVIDALIIHSHQEDYHHALTDRLFLADPQSEADFNWRVYALAVDAGIPVLSASSFLYAIYRARYVAVRDEPLPQVEPLVLRHKAVREFVGLAE